MKYLNRANLLEQAKTFYPIKSIIENKPGGSGNLIFEVETEQGSRILRVSPYTPERKAHIEFELNWVDYLSRHMDGVAKPVASTRENLYESTTLDDARCILCLFEKAPGKTVDIQNPAEFNEGLFYKLGALMGRMHHLTMQYKGNRILPAFEWTGPFFWRRNIPLGDEAVERAEQSLLKEMGALPKTKDSYGIVHYDIHTDNFFVDNGNLTLFDFYDCQFNWYAADVASALFFMVQRGAGPLQCKSERDRTAFAETFLAAYLKGYRQTNAVHGHWVYTLDLFMRYQMIDEYMAAKNYMAEELGDRHAGYVAWYRDKLVQGLPYVTLDYQKILDSLV